MHRTSIVSALKKAAVILGGTVVFLATLEIALWGLGSLHARGVRTDGRMDAETGEAVFDILCVGDSWTEGRASGRYPTFLSEMLSQRQQTVHVRLYNAGLSGTNSSQTLRALSERMRDEKPDLLLVMTGNNDHHNLNDSTYWRFADESLGLGSILVARGRVGLHSLRVWRLARLGWLKLTGAATADEFFFRSPDNGTAGRDALLAIDLETHRRQLEYNLTKFVELARRHDVPLVFQTYFHFHGYRVNEIIRDVASRHDVPLVDHNRWFHESISAERREALLVPDGHPNSEGYALIASAIVEVLDENHLAP